MFQYCSCDAPSALCTPCRNSCMTFPLETLPPGDPIWGVVYLRTLPFMQREISFDPILIPYESDARCASHILVSVTDLLHLPMKQVLKILIPRIST